MKLLADIGVAASGLGNLGLTPEVEFRKTPTVANNLTPRRVCDLNAGHYSTLTAKPADILFAAVHTSPIEPVIST